MDHKTPQYQIIPRKYRPQTFASIVDQEAIVTTLKNALRFQRLGHAYLFCGCRGTGKTTLARVFAKALNCQRLTENQEPCNACPSCLEVVSGRSLDVLEIDGASNRGIDDIRQINETIGYAPASSKFKIYIIDEVHMLTKEAFNALLKTLEEPPPNVKFFFATTEPHKVLPTIISRCQRFDLNRISLEAMQRKLAWIAQDLQVSCEMEALSLISHLSEGCLRDAESLLDQVICYAEQPITLEKVSLTLGLMPRSAFFALDDAMAAQNLSYAFELAQEIFSSGKDLGHFFDNLVEHFRTLLLIKFGQTPTIFDTEERTRYLSSSSHYTEEQCLKILDYLIHWQQHMLKTPFKRIGLEMVLLHLIRSKSQIPISTLVKRLTELERLVEGKAPPPKTEEKRVEVIASPPPQPVTMETSSSPKTEEKRVEVTASTPPQPVVVEAPSPPKHEEARSLKAETGELVEVTASTPPQPVTMETSSPPVPLEEICVSIHASKQIQTPPLASSSRYETLIRFAAVELEGVVKKE